MKKIIFFTLVIVCLVVCFSILTLAQDKVTLTLGHDGAIGSIQDLAVKEIVKVAKEKSDGRLEIHDFPAAQLGSNLSMIESMIGGSQDLYWGDLSSWLGNFEKDYAIMSMGFVFRDQDHINNFMESPTGQQLKARLLDKGILLLTEHANMLPRVMVSNILIKTPDDVKGLKMRVPEIPIYQKVWEAMGTVPTSVAFNEVYLALSQGLVDATETGFEFVYPMKYYEVAKYVTLTNHVRGLRGMLANPARYEGLPDDLKEILMEAALAGEKLYNQEIETAKTEHAKLLKENGVTITEVDTELFKAKIMFLVDKLENEGFWSKGLFAKIQEIK